MSQEKEQEDENEIKIKDHRRFNVDGTEKDAVAEEKTSSPEEKLPEVDFAGFVLSLAGSVQMALGISPNPFTGKVERDLRQAEQTIELLGMLVEKTKGNLSPEEKQLLEVVLSDLRFRFVEEKKKG